MVLFHGNTFTSLLHHLVKSGEGSVYFPHFPEACDLAFTSQICTSAILSSFTHVSECYSLTDCEEFIYFPYGKVFCWFSSIGGGLIKLPPNIVSIRLRVLYQNILHDEFFISWSELF